MMLSYNQNLFKTSLEVKQMAKIEVSYKHSIKSETKLRGSIWTGLMEMLEQEFNAEKLFIEDDSGDITFNFILGGVFVKGVVQLHDESIDISLKVPFIAMVYKGKIIEKLNEQIPKYLKE